MALLCAVPSTLCGDALPLSYNANKESSRTLPLFFTEIADLQLFWYLRLDAGGSTMACCVLKEVE